MGYKDYNLCILCFKSFLDFTLCVVMRRLVDSAKDARGRRSFDAFLLAQFAKTRADNNTFSIPRRVHLSGHDFRERDSTFIFDRFFKRIF